MSTFPPGEFDLIAAFRASVRPGSRTRVGIGDDCAVLEPSGAAWLLTTDMLMDGRHFDLDRHGPLAVGRKAMGVNLSDIAAMAGRPLAALVAVALPRRDAARLAGPLFEGLRLMAERFGVEIVGGDTNAWDGPLVVSVTLVGEVVSPGPATRSEARVGDIVLVTGPLGGSILGRHLDLSPRIVEALALRSVVERLALIDLSDGLASDLAHILVESGNLGAVLDADVIPVHPDAVRLAERDGRAALDHALADGEDFELCLCVDRVVAERLLETPPIGVRLYRVGEVVAEPGIRLRLADGSLVPCTLRGFDHLAAPPSEAIG